MLARLLVGTVLLGAVSFGSARTAAGIRLEQWFGSATPAEMRQMFEQGLGTNTNVVGPQPFAFGTYSGSITVTKVSDAFNFFYNTTGNGLDAWRSFNDNRPVPQQPPWGTGAYPWTQFQTCLRTDGRYAHFYHRKVKNGSGANDYYFEFYFVSNTTSSAPPVSETTPAVAAGTEPGAVNPAALDYQATRCLSQVPLSDWYYGSYTGGSSHLGLAEDFRAATQQWIRTYHDVASVYSPPVGISHNPLLTPAQAAETGPTPPGGSTTGGTTGGSTTGGTTGGGTDWSTAPVDDELQCRIIDIPCNLRKLFMPQVDWPAEWQEMKDVLSTKMPFNYISWLSSGAASATAQDIGISVCAPVVYESFSLDWCNSPAVIWWKTYGVKMGFALCYISYLVGVVNRIKA